MIKLFDNQELTSEEIIFIGNNLVDKEVEFISYDHTKENSFEACGLTKELVEQANKDFANVSRKCERTSELIEELEKITSADPMKVRMMIMQSVKASLEHSMEKKLTGIGGLGDISEMIARFLRKKRDENNDNEE